MQTTTSVQTLNPVLSTITGYTEFVQNAKSRSVADHGVALRLPLQSIVESTIHAATARSEHTERAYRATIGAFVDWLDQTRGNIAPMEWRPFVEKMIVGKRVAWSYHAPTAVLLLVNQATLDEWRDVITEQASPNTVTSRIFAIRTFLRVALRDGVLTQEQAINMGLRPYVTRQVRDEQPTGRRLATKEVRALRQAIDTTTIKGKRDLAILDAMLFAALRRDEVCKLRPTNIVLDNGRRWILLRGKGHKTRKVKVHDALYASLIAWMETINLNWCDDSPLFTGFAKGDKLGKHQIDGNAIAHLVEEYANRAQIGDLNPHDLRRTAARNAYDNHAGLIQVQLMLGHADPKTTAHYIGADFDDANTATDHIVY